MHRLRSMVWLAVVKARYPGPSCNGMDTHFLGDEGKGTRTFWRIQRDASDPGLPRTSLEDDSVVDRVARLPGYFHTRGIYLSGLFAPKPYPAVLGPTALTVFQREALTRDVLSRLGLVDVSDDDRRIAEASALVIPGAEPGTVDSLRRWLAYFGRKRNIDHILLMCLLYRRAVERGALEEAIEFRDAIMDAIARFCSRPGFDGDIQTLWMFMTWRRVIIGRTGLDHTQDALDRAEHQLPGAFFEITKLRKHFEWHRWMMANTIELHRYVHCHWSRIVPRTAAWEHFERNRGTLEEQVRRDALARSLRGMRRVLRRPEDQRIDASTRLAEMAGYAEPWRSGDY